MRRESNGWWLFNTANRHKTRLTSPQHSPFPFVTYFEKEASEILSFHVNNSIQIHSVLCNGIMCMRRPG